MSLNDVVSANTRSLMARSVPQKRIGEFAKALDYSAHYAGQKYHGKKAWNLDDLENAADWLGVEPVDLLKSDSMIGDKAA